jgi:hypothetical protein
MIAVSLCVEACASMRLPFLHEMRTKTMQRYPASQPGLTRDKSHIPGATGEAYLCRGR